MNTKLIYFLAFLGCTLLALSAMQLQVSYKIARGFPVDPLVVLLSSVLTTYMLGKKNKEQGITVSYLAKSTLLVAGVVSGVIIGFIAWGVFIEVDFFANIDEQVYTNLPELNFSVIIYIFCAFLGLVIGGQIPIKHKRTTQKSDQ